MLVPLRILIMKVLMTGGGTGGHVNPALAIANTIKMNEPGSVIGYVGTSKGIENKLVPPEGYKLFHVEIQGIRRNLSPANLKTAYLALTSPIKGKKVIEEFQPDIVIGTGGYVCWPVIKAAADMGIPTALHESNAVPGVAVKMLAKYCDRIFLNFKETAEFLAPYADKIVHVGNPLRGAFLNCSRSEARRKLEIDGKYKYFVLSYGGSMGAEHINDSSIEFMDRYVRNHPEVLHIHATGAIEFKAASEKFNELGLDKVGNVKLLEYIYDMPVQMAAADVILSRAGAMTVSELAMMGKCSIMCPSPNVTNNHQYKNAKVLADSDAVLLIEEKELSGDRLIKEISNLLSDDEKRAEMEKNIRKFHIGDANKRIYNDIAELIKNKNKNRNKDKKK